MSAIFGVLPPHKSNGIAKSNKAMMKPLLSRCLKTLVTINNKWVVKNIFVPVSELFFS